MDSAHSEDRAVCGTTLFARRQKAEPRCGGGSASSSSRTKAARSGAAVVDLEAVAGRIREVDGVVVGPVGHLLRSAHVSRAGAEGDVGEAVDLGAVGGPERDAVLVRRMVGALDQREVGGRGKLAVRREDLPLAVVRLGVAELREQRAEELERL